MRKTTLLATVLAVTLVSSYYYWNGIKVGFYHTYDYSELSSSNNTPDYTHNKTVENTSAYSVTTATATHTETSTVDTMVVNKLPGVWHSVMKRIGIGFSAYYDDRSNPNVSEIRVIAELQCQSEKSFFCKLYFAHNLSTMVEAKVKMINIECNQPSEAHFIVCPIPDSLVGLYPTSLQLFANTKKPIGLVKVVPHLVIIYPPTHTEHKLAICVGRMFNFHDWLQLAFFIEFYKVMGATKFVFYTRSHTKDVETLLKYYEQDGLIDVIPFPVAPDLDLVSSKDLERGTHAMFQLVQMTDCSYWMRGKAKFAANIDTDEFILPHTNETLLELLEKNHVEKDWDGFLFRSHFHQQNWPDQLSLKLVDSVIQRFVNLSKVVYPYSIPCPFSSRAKSVNKPNSIVRIATHGVHESMKPAPLLKQIDLDQAVIVHLRKMRPTEQPTKSGSTADCYYATDNTPAGNPLAKHLDRLTTSILKSIREAIIV